MLILKKVLELNPCRVMVCLVQIGLEVDKNRQIKIMTKIKLIILKYPRIREVKYKMRLLNAQANISLNQMDQDKSMMNKKLEALIENKLQNQLHVLSMLLNNSEGIVNIKSFYTQLTAAELICQDCKIRFKSFKTKRRFKIKSIKLSNKQRRAKIL